MDFEIKELFDRVLVRAIERDQLAVFIPYVSAQCQAARDDRDSGSRKRARHEWTDAPPRRSAEQWNQHREVEPMTDVKEVGGLQHSSASKPAVSSVGYGQAAAISAAPGAPAASASAADRSPPSLAPSIASGGGVDHDIIMFREWREWWLRRPSHGRRKRRDVMFMTLIEPETDAEYDRISAVILALVDRPKQSQYMPSDIERKVLDRSYPVPALRGQHGVFARVRIPAFTPVAIYEGKWTRLDHETVTPSARVTERKHVLASFPNLWKRGRTTWTDFDIDGAVSGNEMADSMNDYRLDVKKDISRPSTRTSGSGPERVHNCQFELFLVQGIPKVAVVTTMTIHPDQELLLDYGIAYWKIVLAEQAAGGGGAATHVQ